MAAFMDINPVTDGHVLVVPPDHDTLIAEVPRPTRTRLFETAVSLGEAARRSRLRPAGINLLLADGAAAGQEVPHVHMHVIPRYAADGFRVDAKAWRAPRPRREKLDGQAAALREALAGYSPDP